MNLLFITVLDIKDINDSSIYADLMRKFAQKGHSVTIACPTGNNAEPTTLIKCSDSFSILRVKTDRMQKINIIRKGIATLLIESQF